MPDPQDFPEGLSAIEPPTAAAAPSIAPEASLAPSIPRYRIFRLIGAGGMGAVWEAEQDQPARVVALKAIRPGLLTPALRRRFELEVQILGRLQHPGIAQIYEAGFADTPLGPQPFFAMELVRGPRLDEYIAGAKPPLQERLKLLAAICDAVQHAHQRGVVHRDLKPANILVTDSGAPKILDFGVARAVDSDLQTTTFATEAGQIVGSLTYMSPEQAAGRSDEIDTRADVYALGAIAYELLSDRPPHELRGLSLAQAVLTIREQTATRLGTLVPECRGDLETIVGKAMAREKDQRYSTASDLAGDIRRFLDYEPIAARPPSVRYRVGRFVRRHRVVVAFALIAIVAMLTGTIVSTWMAIRAVRAERQARLDRAAALQRFEDVRELANRFLFDIHAMIQSLPGSTPAVKKLVETGLVYLNKLSTGPSDNPRLLEEIATSYMKLGDIQGYPGRAATLGDRAGAWASYRRALELHEQLAKRAPDNWRLQSALMLDLDRIGEMQLAEGDVAAAAATYQRALDHLRAIQERNVGGWEARRIVASMLRKRGNTNQRLGKPSDAIADYQQAAEIERKLVVELPDNPELKRALASTLQRLAAELVERGDDDAGRAMLYECLALAEALVKGEPLNTRYRQDLAVTRRFIAKIEARRKQYPAAVAAITPAVEDLEALQRADPANVGLAMDISRCLNVLSDALLSLGDDAAALRAIEKAVAIDRRRYKADPNRLAIADLAASLMRLAHLQGPMHTPAVAIATAREAVELLQTACEQAPPEDLGLWDDLATTREVLAELYDRAGDSAAARQQRRLVVQACDLLLTRGERESHTVRLRERMILALNGPETAPTTRP